ncbi:PDR/VanB family oxidoreductase [Variovorax sp. RA8]|uniref:PDR/VanB family oxidoreductase n=1 Tax=Variovorax sp. (strain JCM 16519 / RA8) TaxID=662548 RepID=UPI00131832CE|nr:PDR/VanB family oxidoreductase [Variovorax sp. RA8]VTU18994.1 Phenoxybenzoate dioxygenase subunit beta [Variovorax sp. RA8]
MSASTLIEARVQRMRLEAPGVLSLELRAANEGELPAFEAGAHLDLHLPNGLVRSYSLINPAGERNRYVVAVQEDRASRGGSRYVHQQLRVGSTLPISAPRNHFRLHEEAPHSVLVAGGIGVTPLLAMLRRLAVLDRTADFFYCARSRREAAFVGELERLAGERVHLQWHFDDEAGAPPDLRHWLAGRPAEAHFYGCGPAPMLAAFERACEALGHANVHVERFAAPGIAPALEEEGAFSIELRRSGRTLEVVPGRSILDTLLDAGVDADHSCKEGVCGACETRVLAGEVEHRDGILTQAERAANKSMMLCVSRCRRGPLVLDL